MTGVNEDGASIEPSRSKVTLADPSTSIRPS